MRKTATLTALQAEALANLIDAAAGVLSVSVAIMCAGLTSRWRDNDNSNATELRKRLAKLVLTIVAAEQQIKPTEAE